jgi:glycosyltransferase involved in cell wall biosynthesis
VVIRAFNEEQHIGRLLTGILEQTLKDVEIILVDSGSTDATVAIASRFPVRVLHMDPGDFTFGRSLNKGCAHAQGEYIVIASAHVYPVYPDWLEELLAPFGVPEVALVYGKQRGDDASRFSEMQIFASWFPDESNPHQRHPFCNNANAAIRRELWEQRPYDETLPGLEDLDWASWALSQGHRIVYSARAEVIHVHEETYAQIYNRYRREAMGLKQIHPQQSFRLYDLLRLYLSNVFSDLWHALGEGRLRREFFSVLAFRWMQFWGTYRGFRQAGPLTGELKRAFYYPREMGSSSQTSGRSVEPINYRRLAGRGQGGSSPDAGEMDG